MNSQRIGLFPLEVVLFPAMELPLHIFEPRYKLMIRKALRKEIEFGVILTRGESIADVGCTAAIQKIARKYKDGRMDIVTAGNKRFRVISVFDERPYLEADVEYLSTNPEPATRSTHARLLELFRECYLLMFENPPELAEPSGSSELTFLMAAAFPLSLELKQTILESESDEDRQQILIDSLEAMRPHLAKIKRVRGIAKGNGHGAREATKN